MKIRKILFNILVSKKRRNRERRWDGPNVYKIGKFTLGTVEPRRLK